MAYNNNINNGSRTNEITLGDNQPLDNNLKPIKVGGETSILEVSSPTPDQSIDGIFKIDGKLKAKDVFIQGNFNATSIESPPQFSFHSRDNKSVRLDVRASANQNSQLRLQNIQGYWDLKREYSTTTLQFTDGTNTPLILDGNNVQFVNLSDGTIAITDFVDEDDMASNSAVKLPTQQSVKAYVDNELAGLVDSAPAALDTLNELASALNDDASFSTTVTNSLATKLNLSGGTLTGALTIHTATDAMLNFKASDDSWSYMQFLQNDGDRIAYIGTDSDQDRLIIAANENGANEVEINTTTVDINANVDISGIITNAEWNGDVIASAYLDSDTAHLTGSQTFSGTKTFSAGTIFGGDITLNADNKIKSDTTGTHNFIEFDDDSGSPENQTIVSSVTNVALIVDGNGNNTGQFEVLKAGTDSTATELFRIENDGDAVFTGSATIANDLTVDTDTLKVDSTNNAVSIGSATGSPNMKLEVVAGENNGILVNRNSTSTSSPVEVGFRHTTSAGDASTGMRSYRTNEDTSYDQELRFFTTAGSGGQAEHLTIKHNGKVGIGTTSPGTTLDVEGSISYKHVALTADSDDLDVSGVAVVECTPSGTDRLGGLTGGVQGQILYILKVDSGFGRIIIEHAEGTGNQDIYLISGSDLMLSSRSGITLYCTGSEWIQVG